ncbi:hypothetical protein IEQ34_023686 [Dendrobium chrysotoxum]|uniref:Uncharacterized protein n=1 Tax=Dendrobium chrysotoxum TaxID=161865 RepID=A0AAV7FVI0_DENCH|nr:hypothetical protein IEQ34_023686 [Dendrobium chrysotoxum]
MANPITKFRKGTGAGYHETKDLLSKRFDSELLYVQGPIWKNFRGFPFLCPCHKQFEIPRLFQNRSESNSNDSKHFFFHYTISETQGLDRMDM